METGPDSIIPLEDSTPTISDQAGKEGWECRYFNFGKAEIPGIEYFNPSIVERPDGLWLLCRRAEPHPQGFQFGQNSVWAFKLDEDGITPTFGKRLRWITTESSQHFEDPRGFYHPLVNQTVIGACTFIWYHFQPWTGAHQCIGMFDNDWNCVRMNYPKVGGNPGEMKRIEKPENYEKNWLWWLHSEKLHLLYKAKPWVVCQFGDTWGEHTYWKDESGASWAWGDIRGGTPPIKVGNYYYTFHHSSLPWKGRYRRYYAGCLAFESEPPFRPKLITKEPILIGSQNDPWTQKKPLVVFPCGAIFRGEAKDGNWLVTLGVNDIKAAWLKLSHHSLLEKMSPITEPPVFSQSGLSAGEIKKQKLRDNAAKARAALATKRMAANGASGVGEVPPDPAPGVVSPNGTSGRPLRKRKKKRARNKKTLDKVSSI